MVTVAFQAKPQGTTRQADAEIQLKYLPEKYMAREAWGGLACCLRQPMQHAALIRCNISCMKRTFKERMTAVTSRCLINKTNEKHELLTLWHIHSLRRLFRTSHPRSRIVKQTAPIIELLAHSIAPVFPLYESFGRAVYAFCPPSGRKGERGLWYLLVLAVHRRASFRRVVAQRMDDGDLGCHVFFDFTLRTPTPAKKKILIAVTNPVKRTLNQSAERIAPRLNRFCCLRLA